MNEDTLIPQHNEFNTCLSLASPACTLSTAATSIIRVLLTVVLATVYGIAWIQLVCALQGAVKAAVPTLMRLRAPLLVIRMSQKFASSEPDTLAFFGFLGAFVHCLAVVLLVGLSRRARGILEQCTEWWGSLRRRGEGGRNDEALVLQTPLLSSSFINQA